MNLHKSVLWTYICCFIGLSGYAQNSNHAVCQAVISNPASFSQLQWLYQQGANLNCDCEVRQKTNFITMDRTVVSFYDPAIPEAVLQNLANDNTIIETIYVNPIYIALSREDYGLIRLLTRNGVDINSSFSNGMLPLEFALHANSKKLIDFLLKIGAKPEFVNLGCPFNPSLTKYLIEKGTSASTIELSCALNNPNQLKELLALMPNFKDQNLTQHQLFSIFQNPSLFQTLLQHGFNVNGQTVSYNKYNVRKETPYLIHAVKEASNAIIELFLEKEIEVNVVDERGYTALFYAILLEKTDLIQKLIEKGADLNIIAKNGEDTPLILAMEHTPLSTVELLLEKGADPNLKISNTSRMPITKALESKNQPSAQLLAKYNKNPAVFLNYYKSDFLVQNPETLKFILSLVTNHQPKQETHKLLQKAVELGETEAVSILLEHTKGFQTVDESEKKPVMIAFEQKNFPLVYQLLAAGAAIDTATEGLLLLQEAIITQNMVWCHQLIQLGVSPIQTFQDGQTPLTLALEQKNYQILKLILQHSPTPTCETMLNAVKTNNLEIIKLVQKFGGDPTCSINGKKLWQHAKALSTYYYIQFYLKKQ